MEWFEVSSFCCCFKAWILILMVFLELCLLHVSESSQKHFTPSILIFVLVNTISVHKRPRVCWNSCRSVNSKADTQRRTRFSWSRFGQILVYMLVNRCLSITSVALKYTIQLILCLQGLQLCSGYLLITNKTIVVKEQGNR